jgi:hypothetical protein
MKISVLGSSIIKVSRWILALGLLLVLSEGIFMIRNKPPIFTQFMAQWYFNRAKWLADQGEIAPSLKALMQSAEILVVNDNHNLVKEKQEFNTNEEKIKLNDNFRTSYVALISSLATERVIKQGALPLSRVLYEVGLLAYRDQELSITETTWKLANRLQPQWSYYFIELANWYRLQGNFQQQQILLEKCLSFPTAREHCQLYVNQGFKGELPGFLEPAVIANMPL